MTSLQLIHFYKQKCKASCEKEKVVRTDDIYTRLEGWLGDVPDSPL